MLGYFPVRAVVYTERRTLEVIDKPDPSPAPEQVVVEVGRCGICGSDLHLHRAGILPPGAVLGHEFAGTVVATGKDATGVAEGADVAVLPGRRCGICRNCTEGRDAVCLGGAALEIGLGTVDGGYAQFAAVPASSCFPLPEGTTAEQGALVEPYGVALHAVRRSRLHNDPARNRTAAVIGAGPIGLMTLAALHHEGVEDIVVAERSPARAELARRMGASAVVDDAHALAHVATAELDVVFECAGVPATPQIAMEQVRTGGEVVLVGITNPDEPLTLSSFLWIIKELDVKACVGYETADFADAVRHVSEGAVDPGLVVTDTRPLEDAQAVFDELLAPEGASNVKVLLKP